MTSPSKAIDPAIASTTRSAGAAVKLRRAAARERLRARIADSELISHGSRSFLVTAGHAREDGNGQIHKNARGNAGGLH
jgi:hypothetical protein